MDTFDNLDLLDVGGNGIVEVGVEVLEVDSRSSFNLLSPSPNCLSNASSIPSGGVSGGTELLHMGDR